MTDYYKAGDKLQVPERFGGNRELTDTPNDLWPHILAAAEQTLRRLPNPNRENG